MEDTAIRAGSSSGSNWRSGVAGSIHWLFCSKPLKMYGSPTKPESIRSLAYRIAGAYRNVKPSLVRSPRAAASAAASRVLR